MKDEFQLMVSKKIKAVRNVMNLSQRQMAEQLSISRDLMAKYETTICPSAEFLFSFSEIYNLSIKELLNPKTAVEDFIANIKIDFLK